MISAVCGRELRALFRSPLAWVLLCFVQFIVSYQFLTQVEIYQRLVGQLRQAQDAPGITEIIFTPVVHVAALLMLFVVPIVAMHALSGERRQGTLPLLYSAPLTSWQIVAGKFLGIGALLALLWLLIALLPLCLRWDGALDFGIYGAGLMALALLMAMYLAVGLMCSAFFTHATLAALSAFGILVTLWLSDWGGRFAQDSGVFSQLSSDKQFSQLADGLLDSYAIAYFVILTGFALYAAKWRLDGDRKPL